MFKKKPKIKDLLLKLSYHARIEGLVAHISEREDQTIEDSLDSAFRSGVLEAINFIAEQMNVEIPKDYHKPDGTARSPFSMRPYNLRTLRKAIEAQGEAFPEDWV